MDSSPSARLTRALNSLEGLSVGDAFGEQFFAMNLLRFMDNKAAHLLNYNEEAFNETILKCVRARQLPIALDWEWTDDTALALEVVAELREHEEIRPDSLARRFSSRYTRDPARGYGFAMYSLLPRLENEDWREAAPSLFNGQGSYGNGSAMRVPPLGAYFADDFDLLVEQARLSAIVTHSHEEAIAGAIATAIAAAIAVRLRDESAELTLTDYLNEIIAHTPASEVKNRLIQCRDFPTDYTSEQVASLVGSGSDVTCQDTVPFCCWCAAHPASADFSEAMWLTVAGLGDRDTTCAIVGGIVGARVGKREIPAEWRARREPLTEY
ncbi:crystallin J1 [bacterium]|nr:MAG: crystallin J1 [bacterium]